MLNALALRCRNPSEFIASVVEHHRGVSFPRGGESKTYLVFVGPEDDEDILAQIPGPDGEPTEAREWRDGDGDDDNGRARGYGEGGDEEEYLVMDDENGGEEDGLQSATVKRVWRIPRRIQIRRVEVEEANEGFDGIERKYRDHSKNDDGEGEGEGEGEENSSKTSEDGEFSRRSDSHPIIQGDKVRGRIVRGSGFRPNSVRGYYSNSEDGEGGGEELSEAIDEELVRQFSRLPSNLEEMDEGMSNGEDYAISKGDRITSENFSSSEDLVEKFSQLRPLQGESDGTSDNSSDDSAEEKCPTISNSQKDSNKARQREQKNESNSLVDYNDGIELYTAKEFPQTYLLESIPQSSTSGPPILKLHDEESSMSSPLSSPPPDSGEEDGPGEETGPGERESSESSTEGGEGGKQEVFSDSESESDICRIEGMNIEKPNGAIYQGREESVELYGVGEQEVYHTANKVSPQIHSRRLSVLQIREPQSPIRPRPDEISPLTTPPNSSPLNAEEVGSALEEDRYPAAAVEDENLLYPVPTVENLVATENVDIICLPDLEALRAFLEFLKSSPVISVPNPPLLAIWGLVSAHYETEYFGGKGIGLTVAWAVEAAAESGRLLVLGEGYIEVDYGDGEEEVQELCWTDVEVPIINNGSMIVGRTVEVGDILRRWCRFGEDFDYEAEGGGEEEEGGGGGGGGGSDNDGNDSYGYEKSNENNNGDDGGDYEEENDLVKVVQTMKII